MSADESAASSKSDRLEMFKKKMELVVHYKTTGRYPPGLDSVQKKSVRRLAKVHVWDNQSEYSKGMFVDTLTISEYGTDIEY